MSCKRFRLGDLIELCNEKNSSGAYTLSDVRGISIQKNFIETKANMEGVSLYPYLLVKPDDFAYVTVTSRNGEKITLAHNTTTETFIVSSSYIVFRVLKKNILNSDYLFLFLNRPEFDRYARANSWGSARETFNWEDMCDIELDLPDLPTQEKYVAIYKAMQANQQSYERGLEDLKLVCEGYIDKLKACLPHERIGEYIALSEQRNDEGKYTVDDVRGVSIEKRFIETKANMQGVNLKPYYVIKPDAFAFVTVTSRNGEKISLAHNGSNDTYICSSSYVVFTCTNTKKLLPRYLRLFFERSEFNRYVRFNSWGSARETFDFSDMQDVRIPIPDISIQTALADLFDTYLNRRTINEKLKTQLNAMCPILIRGSLSDGG